MCCSLSDFKLIAAWYYRSRGVNWSSPFTLQGAYSPQWGSMFFKRANIESRLQPCRRLHNFVLSRATSTSSTQGAFQVSRYPSWASCPGHFSCTFLFCPTCYFAHFWQFSYDIQQTPYCTEVLPPTNSWPRFLHPPWRFIGLVFISVIKPTRQLTCTCTTLTLDQYVYMASNAMDDD